MHVRSSIATHLLPEGKPEDATLAMLVGGADAGACEEDDEPPTDDEAEGEECA